MNHSRRIATHFVQRALAATVATSAFLASSPLWAQATPAPPPTSDTARAAPEVAPEPAAPEPGSSEEASGTAPSKPTARATDASTEWKDPAADSPSEPEAKPPRALMHFAFNFAAAHNTLSGGDFDGSRALIRPSSTGGTEAVLVPELGSGSGVLLGLGYGFYPEATGSLGFWVGMTYSATWLSPHLASAPTASNSAILHDLDFPLRIAYRASRRVVPYVQLSFGAGFLSISGFHASVDSSGVPSFDGQTTSLTSRSVGFGLGSYFPLSKNIAVDAFVGYRTFSVSNVDGADLDNSLSTGGWTLHLGPAFFF